MLLSRYYYNVKNYNNNTQRNKHTSTSHNLLSINVYYLVSVLTWYQSWPILTSFFFDPTVLISNVQWCRIQQIIQVTISWMFWFLEMFVSASIQDIQSLILVIILPNGLILPFENFFIYFSKFENDETTLVTLTLGAILVWHETNIIVNVGGRSGSARPCLKTNVAQSRTVSEVKLSKFEPFWNFFKCNYSTSYKILNLSNNFFLMSPVKQRQRLRTTTFLDLEITNTLVGIGNGCNRSLALCSVPRISYSLP